MKITQEELNRRLGSSTNLVNSLGNFKYGKLIDKAKKDAEPVEDSEVKSKKGNDENNRNNCGRKEEIPNAPKSLRLVAGILAKAEGNSAQVARNLSLTPGQVIYAKETNDTKLTEKQVEEMALTRLMDTLGLLTIDVIAGEKPKDIASIAANLSRVHTNLKPREVRDANQVNVTIYAPKQRELKDYDVVEIQAVG